MKGIPRGDKEPVPMLSDTHPPLLAVEQERERRAAWRRSSSALGPSPSSGGVAGDVVFYTQPVRRPINEPLYGGSHRGTAALPEIPPSQGAAADETGGDRGRTLDYLVNPGQLGMCNNPYCPICPGAYQAPVSSPRRNQSSLTSSWGENRERIWDGAANWAKKAFRLLSPTSVFHPHAKDVQRWNKFFVVCCLVAVFVDPLFLFVLSVNEDFKCILYSRSFAIVIAVIRSFTDFVYFLHILLQFRLTYVDPESRVVGTGDWVVDPKKIAINYLRGIFLVDLLNVIPLPQVMILIVIPTYLGVSAANYAKNFLRATILLQYLPRIFRILPLIAGESSSGFIFESARSNFIMNILMFVLAGHVVGSCWYLFGFQRVNKCLREACLSSQLKTCRVFLDCGRGPEFRKFPSLIDLEIWKKNEKASLCFSPNSHFNYGIYGQAPIITKRRSVIVRYVYSLFWGFQQISTFAGNQVPSDFVWEVLFTMSIIALGLLLFALLIGNIQNFLQSLGRRKLEMQLRRRDVEQWMSHRRLPSDLMTQVRLAERFSWSATRGVNEEELMKNFPENLQKDIRRHLFQFLKRVRIFSLMDEPILDAFHKVLTQKLYLAGSKVQEKSSLIETMVFIVRGEMESIGGDGIRIILREGNVCGEELLAWHLESNSLRKNEEKHRISRQKLYSSREVKCLTNVEAFVLHSSELEDVTSNFERFLRKPSVQGAIS